MSPTRREVLAQLAALAVAPRLPFALNNADPLDGTIAAYQAGRQRKQWSAAEAVAEAIERCRTAGARLHAIDALSPTALDEARASDERRRHGKLHGPLDGVPVFAKSIYDMRGLPTTGSNAEWARLFPDAVQRDAVEVARMRAVGAIVLGKTAADDFAYHGSGTSTYTGQVINPHDLSGVHTPGGSSAGSAVSVQQKFAFAALGTDDGGSNRIPAQFTGVVGMKPTFGLVARDGVIPTWPYLDTHGPLARNAEDAALLLAAIAGADINDPLSTGKHFAAPHQHKLKGARLGLVEAHIPRDKMTSEAVATWDRIVGELERAGAIVTKFTPAVTRANFRDAFVAAATQRGDVAPSSRSPAATANALYKYFAGRSDNPKELIRRGYTAYRSYYDVLPATYEECEALFAQPMESDPAGRSFARSRAEVNAQLAASMRGAKVEAMIYPTMPYEAFELAKGWPEPGTPLGYGNWLGLPEVSVPTVIGTDGLPALNISFVGLPGDDARVLMLANAFQTRE